MVELLPALGPFQVEREYGQPPMQFLVPLRPGVGERVAGRRLDLHHRRTRAYARRAKRRRAGQVDGQREHLRSPSSGRMGTSAGRGRLKSYPCYRNSATGFGPAGGAPCRAGLDAIWSQNSRSFRLFRLARGGAVSTSLDPGERQVTT